MHRAINIAKGHCLPPSTGLHINRVYTNIIQVLPLHVVYTNSYLNASWICTIHREKNAELNGSLGGNSCVRGAGLWHIPISTKSSSSRAILAPFFPQCRNWYAHVGQEVPVFVYTLLIFKPVKGHHFSTLFSMNENSKCINSTSYITFSPRFMSGDQSNARTWNVACVYTL